MKKNVSVFIALGLLLLAAVAVWYLKAKPQPIALNPATSPTVSATASATVNPAVSSSASEADDTRPNVPQPKLPSSSSPSASNGLQPGPLHSSAPEPTLSSPSQSPPSASVGPASTRESSPSTPTIPDREISFLPGMDEWDFSILYGARFISVSQSGALGSVDLGVLFLNNFNLQSDFHLNDWHAWFQLDSYSFKYEASGKSDEQSLVSLDLGVAYHWLMLGVDFKQTPLFQTQSDVTMAQENAFLVSVGAFHQIDLEARKPTTLDFKGWIQYPLSVSSGTPDLKISSASGFGALAQAQLTRQLFARDEYSLHLTWMTRVGYEKLSRNVQWDSYSGKVDSDFVEASTMIGVLLGF